MSVSCIVLGALNSSLWAKDFPSWNKISWSWRYFAVQNSILVGNLFHARSVRILLPPECLPCVNWNTKTANFNCLFAIATHICQITGKNTDKFRTVSQATVSDRRINGLHYSTYSYVYLYYTSQWSTCNNSGEMVVQLWHLAIGPSYTCSICSIYM